MQSHNKSVLRKMTKYKVKTSNKCIMCSLYKIGIYRFLCEDTFICIGCIKEKTIKEIETDRLVEYCEKCKEPINPTFVDHIANSDYHKVRQRASYWKKDNTK